MKRTADYRKDKNGYIGKAEPLVIDDDVSVIQA